jgi:hypothetical protein
MKIRPVVAELFHADGDFDSHPSRQTYIMKLTVAFVFLGDHSINNKVFREPQLPFQGIE